MKKEQIHQLFEQFENALPLKRSLNLQGQNHTVRLIPFLLKSYWPIGKLIAGKMISLALSFAF